MKKERPPDSRGDIPGPVSVVICTYNGERFVREQLDSVVRQTCPPDEIVVSDDGSTDRTLAIVDEVIRAAPADSNISWRVETRENRIGVTENFATACTWAGGSLIALCDQDDIWAPQKLEILLEALRERPADLVFTDAVLINSCGDETGSLLAPPMISNTERAMLLRNPLAALLRRNYVTGATVMVSARMAKASLPVPAGWVHDEWFAANAASIGSAMFVPKRLISYRQHGGNLIGARRDPLVTEAMARLRVARGRSIALAERKNIGWIEINQRADARIQGHTRERIKQKVEFDIARAGLPTSRLRRLPRILRWWLTGKYSHFSRDQFEAVRDLVIKK